MLDENLCRMAFEARNREADGRFVAGVMTTGIYCRPSCPARRPRPENVRFYSDAASARADGLRACLRCKPDEADAVETGIARAVALIDSADAPPPLAVLAEAAGLSSYYFHRRFREIMGITPAAYARQRRAARVQAALSDGGRVTDAVYDAGYTAPGRFYAEAGKRLGMKPSVWRQGGKGQVIRFAVAATGLGPLLIAATDKGICRLAFDEGEADLRSHFPAAELQQGDAAFDALVAQAVALVESPGLQMNLPLDVRGTAFQEAVWQALTRIPAGETRTYAELASAVGRPRAVRAVGSACGANPVAVVIPCHRAKRTDGGLGGYAYGVERKQKLLDRETTA